MGDLAQLVGTALGIFRPERETQDRHVVDTLRLHERLQHAEAMVAVIDRILDVPTVRPA